MRRVFSNPSLRRLELALAGSATTEWAYSVGLAVYAYDVGGASLVGLSLFLRFTPAALAAPFVGAIADRYRRELVLVGSQLGRALVVGLAAVIVLVDGAPAIVFVLSTIYGVLATAFEPAHRALLPSIARDPEELTAANVAASTIDSVTWFAGPAVAAVLLAATSVEVAFAATAAGLAGSAALLIGIKSGRARAEPAEDEHLWRHATAGVRAIVSDPALRVLVGLTSAQTFVSGALNVLVVVVALELLDWGDSGVGILMSALGVGGLIGAVVTLAITVGRGLSRPFMAGLLLWGVPIALLAAWSEPAFAIALLALVGLGNTLVDVTAYTLLQRAVPDDVLARVFGVLESLIVGTIALGSLLTPVLLDAIGTEATLVFIGALLPVLAALCWRRVEAIDVRAPLPERRLAMLRALPLFSPLPSAALEQIARSLEPVQASKGEEVFRQGEPGDRFYIVAQGEVDVLVDGRLVRTQAAGDHFGEIALLREVPRTATVRARTDAELYALERDEFIAAVTGHPETAAAAETAIATRLAHARPRFASV